MLISEVWVNSCRVRRHCSLCCVSVMVDTAPWPLLTSLIHAHWPSIDSFHSVTWGEREANETVMIRRYRLNGGKRLEGTRHHFTCSTLLSPPETASMFPVMDQLTCQTTSLNLWSSLADHVLPAGSSHVQINTRPSYTGWKQAFARKKKTYWFHSETVKLSTDF